MSSGRKHATAEQRRQQVVAAARTCFQKKGFHQTSIAEISVLAGMSVGHIYRYFKNKEEIIGAIVEHMLDKHLASLTALSEASNLIEASVRLDQSDEMLPTREEFGLMLEVSAEAARNPAIAQMVQRADGILRGRVRAMMRDARPQWSDDRIDAAIEIMATLGEGRALRSLHNPEGSTPAVAAAREKLIRWLLQEDGPAGFSGAPPSAS